MDPFKTGRNYRKSFYNNGESVLIKKIAKIKLSGSIIGPGGFFFFFLN